MSRFTALTLAGVSALALSTVTAPVALPPATADTSSSSAATMKFEFGQRVGGGWCC